MFSILEVVICQVNNEQRCIDVPSEGLDLRAHQVQKPLRNLNMERSNLKAADIVEMKRKLMV